MFGIENIGSFLAAAALVIVVPGPATFYRVAARHPGAGGSARDARALAASGGFVKGLLITLTNPKPVLFFGAFFPMFIDKATRSWMQSFYVLGGLFEVLNLVSFSVVILVIAQLRRAAVFERLSAGALNKVSGYGLVLCGTFILVMAFV